MLTCPWQEPLSGQPGQRPREGEECGAGVRQQIPASWLRGDGGSSGEPLALGERASGPSFGLLSTPFPRSEMACRFLSLVPQLRPLSSLHPSRKCLCFEPGLCQWQAPRPRPCAAGPWLGRGCLALRAFLWGPSVRVHQMRRGFKDENVWLSLCVLG